jgi:transmembrane sensor
MTPEQQQLYQELAAKLLAGTATPAEREEYARWLESTCDGTPLLVPEEFAASRAAQERRILAALHQGMKPAPPLYRRARPVLAAAAVLVLLIGGYWLFTRPAKNVPADLALRPSSPANDIAAPATTHATITLAGGRQVLLDSAATGGLANQGSTRLIKLADGAVAYEKLANPGPADVTYNILTNPRGSRPVSLTLADGSQVWLNAASSLRYPTAFSGSERQVELTGEGYFAIAPNPAMPFTVRKSGMEIRVLGTEFNCMAYDDEPGIRVTLLRGAVSVGRATSDGSVLLRPGEQAFLPAGGERVDKLEHPDTAAATAWRRGVTAFHHADVAEIMRLIQRWYDVDVRIEGELPKRSFYAELSRTATLSELLTILTVNKIHYRLDAPGRRLTVMP